MGSCFVGVVSYDRCLARGQESAKIFRRGDMTALKDRHAVASSILKKAVPKENMKPQRKDGKPQIYARPSEVMVVNPHPNEELCIVLTKHRMTAFHMLVACLVRVPLLSIRPTTPNVHTL